MDIGDAVAYITDAQTSLLDQFIVVAGLALGIAVFLAGLYAAWRFFRQLI